MYAPSGNPKGVKSSDLYKTLRAQELTAFRAVTRVFAMHGGDLSRHQRRLLEDLQEHCHVDDDRHAAEVAAARHDPVVKAIRDSQVGASRETFYDGVLDVKIDEDSATDDDGGVVLPPRDARVPVAGHKRPRGGQPHHTRKAHGTSGAATAMVSPAQSELLALRQRADVTCAELVKTKPGERRTQLLTELAAERAELAAFKERWAAELA